MGKPIDNFCIAIRNIAFVWEHFERAIRTIGEIPTRMIRTLHIISSLATGGAEMMLLRRLTHLDRGAFESEVISLVGTHPIGDRIAELGIPVHDLGLRPGAPNPLRLIKMARLIRRFRPDVVQTWMYHADLLGGLTARLVSRAPIFWNIRHSHLDPEKSKRTTICIMRLCARLSASLPRRIVCNSYDSLEVHARAGYAREKLLVIPNGFDLDVFRPDPAARAEVRREYALPDEAPLIGLIGRFDAQKDQAGFLTAAELFLRRRPDAHFLLCGRDVTEQNPQLAAWIEANGLTGRCRLLGDRRDIPRLAAALDLAVSSSTTESFPQVLGEAMACGVPCVATDVGDSARIIGDTGRIVPPRDPQAMAEAWEAMFDLPPEKRAQRHLAARERIRTHYSLDKIIEQYATLYREATEKPH